MPDADDFDVEYFRKLLKGDGEKEAAAPTTPKLAQSARAESRRTAKPPAAGGKKEPTVARRKDKKR